MTTKLTESETVELLGDIEEALQWWEIKGPRDARGDHNRDWRGISKSVQEALSRSKYCTMRNPFERKSQMQGTKMIRENAPASIHGAAALTEMLDCIGAAGMDDHVVAKILTENELSLRALLAYSLNRLPSDS